MNLNKKILLALLPFWDTQIPPLGIACLKGFLQEHGYQVKTIDANTEMKFRELLDKYFDIMAAWVPEDKKGNFKSIGHDVLRNQMMAYLNYEDEKEYIELIKIIVRKTFFIDITDHQVDELNAVAREFFHVLGAYFINLVEKEKPAVLGLSVYSGTLPASVYVFKLLKETYPHIRTVMGGGIFADDLSPGSENFEWFLERNPYIDNIIIGEGEQLFLRLLKGELPGDQRVFTIKNNYGKVLDLSSADIPDFSDFDLEYYAYPAYYASRSCPFQCNFCSATLQWGKYRKKKAKQIVKELSKMTGKYRRQLFLLVDSLLNPIINELAHELIQADFTIYWDGSLRVEKSFPGIKKTRLWRKAGFYRARLGIESGSPKILEAMAKGIKIEDIKNTIRSLAYAGIKTTTYWIVGYPGETEKDFQQTLDLVAELKDDIYETDFRPFFYYKTGQVKSADWQQKNRPFTLYPEGANDTLVVRTWVLDCEPSREETYSRLNRFKETIEKLGIPNIYSLYDLYRADERWKKLHKTAVPALIRFRDPNAYIKECKHFDRDININPGVSSVTQPNPEEINRISKFSIVKDSEDYDFE
ncbi:MAG: radical SAM protein [Candidatus Aminicenantes bacterium]|jgi:radical SAM superfamily enzyme YgiQ (UPF0313 family)